MYLIKSLLKFWQKAGKFFYERAIDIELIQCISKKSGHHVK
jgi:hypothetical protein